MTVQTNSKPRTFRGTDAERVAYAGPIAACDKWISETGVWGWNGTSWVNGGGDIVSVGYSISAYGTATYSTFAAALAAALANGDTNRAVYMMYPGDYAGGTLPTGCSIEGVGHRGSVRFTSLLTLTAASSRTRVANITARAGIEVGAGAASTADVVIDNVDTPPSGDSNGVNVPAGTTGLVLSVVRSRLEAGATTTPLVIQGLISRLSIEDCDLQPVAGRDAVSMVGLSGGQTCVVKDTRLTGIWHSSLPVGDTVDVLFSNCNFALTGGDTEAIAEDAGGPNGTGTYEMSRCRVNGLTVAESLFSGSGTLRYNKQHQGNSVATPGNAVLNTPTGRSAFPAGPAAASAIITNNLVASGDIVGYALEDADATLTSMTAVCGAGAITFTGIAAATGGPINFTWWLISKP